MSPVPKDNIINNDTKLNIFFDFAYLYVVISEKFRSVLCYTDMLNSEEKILIKRIAQRIKQLRNAKGMSQRLMYYDTEINVGRLETGKEDIKITTIDKLCKYFDLTFEEFFRDIERGSSDSRPPEQHPPA